MSYLLTLLVFLLSLPPAAADTAPAFPVAYKGRYRPAEAYGHLWLEGFYGAPELTESEAETLLLPFPPSLNLLWRIHFLGYESHSEIPLFWLEDREAKRLGALPDSRHRFSYRELQQALYQRQESGMAIFQTVAAYHALRAYLALPKPATRFEVASLLPGFWAEWRGSDLIAAAIPPHSPWPFLSKGLLLHRNKLRKEQAVERYKKTAEAWSSLIASLKEFERHFKGLSPMEQAFRMRTAQLQAQSAPPKEIAARLEQEFPLAQRLLTAGSSFKSLPSRLHGEWLSLKALNAQIYDPASNALKPADNFTLFSNAHFQHLRDLYLDLERDSAIFSEEKPSQEGLNALSRALSDAYRPLGGRLAQNVHGKQARYPSSARLEAEALYLRYPWLRLVILLYALAACLWMGALASGMPPRIRTAALSLTCAALLCHSILLIARCYILGRPPVSNMFETVLYVPWAAACLGLSWPAFRRHSLASLALCLCSIVLLTLLDFSDPNPHLDPVQAVLDSQLWLTLHVLLVVGSYGLFLLGALLGHFYLGLSMCRGPLSVMQKLTPLILQTLYGGTALLVVGTILGGVWAAESWGRFWDWDPKESWAFISIGIYLIWIHAYRFGYIASFGLAAGSIIGALAISFTWYGVNYLLGSGLHSYGFGSGGAVGYYAFLGAEALFLTAAYWRCRYQSA